MWVLGERVQVKRQGGGGGDGIFRERGRIPRLLCMMV